MAEFPPSVLAATSEAFGDKLLTYLTANPDGVLKPTQTDKGSKKHKKDKGGESDRHSKGLVSDEGACCGARVHTHCSVDRRALDMGHRCLAKYST